MGDLSRTVQLWLHVTSSLIFFVMQLRLWIVFAWGLTHLKQFRVAKFNFSNCEVNKTNKEYRPHRRLTKVCVVYFKNILCPYLGGFNLIVKLRWKFSSFYSLWIYFGRSPFLLLRWDEELLFFLLLIEVLSSFISLCLLLSELRVAFAPCPNTDLGVEK